MVYLDQRLRTDDKKSQKSLGKTKGTKVLRQITAVFLMALLVLMPAGDGAMAAKSKKKAEGPNNKYASIVIDSATGAVISQKNADKRLHPASLTKVMTLLLLFEAMENGSVRKNDRIRISTKAAAQPPSKIGLSAGSSIRVEDAILSLVTKSANDISVAIAEHLAGSESQFAQRMTNRARSIGMSATVFRNASGLHNPAQISSARDMALLARYVIHRYPNYYRYFGTKQFTYRGKTMTNHNRLMNTYPGMDGFKTGYINASGFNLIASARRGEGRLIGVVFGGRTTKTRNDHMAEILNRGFAQLGDVRYANAAPKPVVTPAPVLNVEPATPQRVAKAPQAGVVVAQNTPEARPVFKTTVGKPAPQTLQLPPDYQNDNPAPQNNSGNFTSLSSLDTNRRIAVPTQGFSGNQIVDGQDPAEEAAAQIKQAVNRGDYSEVTGEGDNDLSDVRRVETALLTAAVYRGDYRANTASAPSSVATNIPPASQSGGWSVQIGAYASRGATDDALRVAHAHLPNTLSHGKPVVAPLETSAGYLFRARLGGFTKDQAAQACQFFRDCLPIAP